MHAPASRRQPSARSRMLSSTDSARAGRGLGDVVTGIVHGVSGVVHDASDVAHDVGHTVDDALRGHLSKLQGDIVQTGIDLAKTGKDTLGVAPGALDPSNNHNSGGSGTGSGAQSHTSGGGGATQPTPPAAPGAGGGEGGAQTASRSVSSSTATPPASATSFSSENSAPAPSTSIHTVVRTANFGWHSQTVNALGYGGAGPEDGQAGNGVWSSPSSAASATYSSPTMPGTLPSNGSGPSAAHRNGFPLAEAAALGAVLGFLVVSALFWAVWLYLRKRRRAAYPAIHRAYVNRMLSVTTARTVSTVPLFISASEAGVKDENPFRHPRDADEDDPFDAASLWRSSTTRSESTLSV